MNSYVRSPRATDQLTEREEVEGIMQTAAPMRLHPLHMPVAPTVVEDVDAEATAIALDTVDMLLNQVLCGRMYYSCKK